MTTPATPPGAQATLAGGHAEMLRQVAAVLAAHPHGAAVRLMFAPAGLELATDEVLIARPDPARRILELHPRRIGDLTTADITAASQLIDPGDEPMTAYAATRPGRGEKYHKSWGNGQCFHWMD